MHSHLPQSHNHHLSFRIFVFVCVSFSFSFSFSVSISVSFSVSLSHSHTFNHSLWISHAHTLCCKCTLSLFFFVSLTQYSSLLSTRPLSYSTLSLFLLQTHSHILLTLAHCLFLSTPLRTQTSALSICIISLSFALSLSLFLSNPATQSLYFGFHVAALIPDEIEALSYNFFHGLPPASFGTV